MIALFDVRNTQFLNKVKARGVIVPFAMQGNAKENGIKLSYIFNNGFWSSPVFDISHANRKARFPLFIIKNISKEGFATNIQIELCAGTRGDNREKVYDFISRTVTEDTQYDIPPGGGITIYKDHGYNTTIDFTSNFAIKITYISEYTREKLTEIYEAVVEVTDLYFVIRKFIDDKTIEEEKKNKENKLDIKISEDRMSYEYKSIKDKLISLDEDCLDRDKKTREFDKHNETHLDFTGGKYRYIQIEKNEVNFLTPVEVSDENIIIIKTKGAYIPSFRKKFK